MSEEYPALECIASSERSEVPTWCPVERIWLRLTKQQPSGDVVGCPIRFVACINISFIRQTKLPVTNPGVYVCVFEVEGSE